MIDIVPMFDLVAIRPEPETDTLPSGIVLPGGNPDKTVARGTIVYVGPGLLRNDGAGHVPPGLVPGQRVVYSAMKEHIREVATPLPDGSGTEKLVYVRTSFIFFSQGEKAA